MPWTLTGLAARAARAVGGPRTVLVQSNLDRAQRVQNVAEDRPDVMSRACTRRFESLSTADRRAIEVACEHMAADAAVIERAVASGAPISGIAALAGAWDALDERARAMVRSPLGRASVGPVAWGDAAAQQMDQTTCGAAVASMMIMMGDPLVAAWVAAGRRPGWHMPIEVVQAVRAADASGTSLITVEERWQALQRVVHRRATRRGLGLAPWPRALGTPPWRIDNVVRYAGLRWRGALIDDARPEELGGFSTYARAALSDGIPVPLYTGGDSAHGLSTVVPRHVVLLVGAEGESFRVYEPSRGRIEHWDPATAAVSPQRALGGWNRVMWAIVPRWRGA